jgi:uncharacterized protein
MKLEQSFTVEAPVEQVWSALIDVERIAPCLPGAEVTGVDDSGAYQGTFTVKLGPTTAAYRGALRMEAVDDAGRTVTMSAKGTDKRGQGGASATIVSTMREEGGSTRVDVLTDFHITGRLARFGRSGMIEDVSKRLMREFAGCLQATIVTGGGAATGGAGGGGAAGATAGAGGAGGAPDAAAPPDPDAADAAVASAGGAAAEAASAGAAPPGADDLADGPVAPAPAPAPAPAGSASPPPLVGRPVERPAPVAPTPPSDPAPEASRTGWLSDWPDGGEGETAAPSGSGAGDSSSAPAVEPPAPVPPATAPEPPDPVPPAAAAEPPPPASAPPEPPAFAPPEPPAADSSSTPVREPPAAASPRASSGPSVVPDSSSEPATEPPAPIPPTPEPPPAGPQPGGAAAPGEPRQQGAPRDEAATAGATAEEPPVRTESIPPPGRPDRPAPPSAKPKSGLSLGERIRRLFRRKKP